jgi:glycerol uptake facilitator-like aquaporin
MRKVLAEFFGTLILVATVVGSGIMASGLSKDVGIRLLINTVSTVAVLAFIIAIFGSTSGAHFNPLVSIWSRIHGELSTKDLLSYMIAQFLGGYLGTLIANAMFSRPLIEISQHDRSGAPIYLGEIVATSGLMLAIGALSRRATSMSPSVLIPLWIGAAYFFTSSTSFANPAVTFARGFSDSFAGIAPRSIIFFVIAQCIGAIVGIFIAGLSTINKESAQ